MRPHLSKSQVMRRGGWSARPVSTVLLLVMLKWIRCHRKSNAQSQNASAIYKTLSSLRVSANVAAALVMPLEAAAGAAAARGRGARRKPRAPRKKKAAYFVKGFITGKAIVTTYKEDTDHAYAPSAASSAFQIKRQIGGLRGMVGAWAAPRGPRGEETGRACRMRLLPFAAWGRRKQEPPFCPQIRVCRNK